MNFIDKEHENFFYGMLKRYKEHGGRIDCYSSSLFYLLGLSSDTRNHFNTLFDIKNHEIIHEGLCAGWQTSGSINICRLAFNLWNGFCYVPDDESGDFLVSSDYVTDNIFCCSYAEYFFEAIRLRYPEYCHVA